MRVEKQLTSVEISNKLHILGVTTPSIFYREWTGAKEDQIGINEVPEYCPDNINCYTVAELGEMLPPRLQIDKYDNGKWAIYWIEANANEHRHNSHKESADTQVDAYAKMLIYLLENKIITL